MGKVEIQTRFENGSISFKCNGRLVKLGAGVVADMMDLIKPGQRVAGEMVSVFVHFWKSSRELICGPNGEQRRLWDDTPRWEHKPYLYADEFILIQGLLHERDLTALANFSSESSIPLMAI